MLTEKCLCGGVRYEIDGALVDARNCRSMRRKVHGAAFRLRASVKARDFHWARGEELITWYAFSPGTQRCFRSRCESPLLSRFPDRSEVYGLPLGCLETDPGVRRAMHIFVGSNRPWFEITDSLPYHGEGPP